MRQKEKIQGKGPNSTGQTNATDKKKPQTTQESAWQHSYLQLTAQLLFLILILPCFHFP